MTPRGPVFPAPRPSWNAENPTFSRPYPVLLPSCPAAGAWRALWSL